jgi:hypothetical protein
MLQRLILPALALALTAIVPPQARTGGDRSKAPQPGSSGSAVGREVEVRFANGSNVLMTLVQERIEVTTDFGKLSVPAKDIRHIDFGLHLDDATRRKIDAALDRLADPNYRQREAAVQELVRLGPRAYLAVRRAARSKDGEAGKRAEMALKRINQKVPARLLPTREEDRIRTSKFTIIGRISTPAIRARAEYFGELDLKPGQMLSMRWLQGAGETEVAVDAARYGSGPDQWLDTGIKVEAHTGLKVLASGQVDLWPQQPGQYLAGPEGMQGGGGAVVVNNRVVRVAGAQSGGALMGRVGAGGTPFYIGPRTRQTPAQGGNLYLHIVPSPWGNASTGTYTVRVTVGPGAEEED